MSASFRTISFTFEAVRGEYLSRTQRATQRPAILSMQQKEIYGKPYVRRIYRMDLNFRGTKLSRIENFRVFRVFIFADARLTILY